MPVTSPAPGAVPSYIPPAASGESSREGRGVVEQPVNPLPRRQLALCAPARRRFRAASRPRGGTTLFQLAHQRRHRRMVRAVVGRIGPDGGSEPVHHQPQQSVLYRQLGQRQTACILNISAPHRSQMTASWFGAGLAAERTGVVRRPGSDRVAAGVAGVEGGASFGGPGTLRL